MLEWLIQHVQIYVIIHVATLVTLLFGYIIAEVLYWFIMVHVWAYEIAKEVYNGVVSGNA
jgi:hypothetical protein